MFEFERDGADLLIHVENKTNEASGDVVFRQGDELIRKLEAAGFANRYRNVLTNGRWTIRVTLAGPSGKAQQRMLAQMVLDVLEDVTEPYPS